MRLLWYVSRRSQPSTASPEVGMAFLISKWARMPMTNQVNGTKNGCIMKNFNKIFFAAVAAAFGLASCSQELTPVEKPQGNLVTVNFGAEASIEPATKATLTTEDELTFKSAWENGDVLSVEYISPVTADNKTITATWTGTSFEAKGLPNEIGSWKYTACYPKPDEKDSHIDFGATRTQKGDAYNSIYDVMIGNKNTKNSAAGKDDEGNDIVFNMDRKTAVAYFHLTGGPADEELVSAKLSVKDGFIASQHAYISDFAFAPTEDLTEITITFPEKAPKASDFQLWFNVLPTMYTKMTLTVETTGHTMTISRNTPEIDEYVAGNLYKVVKAIPAEKWVKKGGETPSTKDFTLVTSALSDWSGSYLLVGEYSTETTPKSSYYAFDESIYVDNTWGKCSEVVVDNNAIASTYGTMALEIVPGTTENTYSIMTPSGKYFSASAKGAFNLLETHSADNCDFTISLGENNAIVIKQASSTKERQIRYNHNGGKGGLRWYEGTTVLPVYLYKGPSVAKYAVSFATVEGGSFSASPSKAEAGAEITLTATPAEGYAFNNDWSVKGADETVIEVVDGKFIMPAQNVTVAGTFSKVAYTITKAAAENGSFTVKNGTEEVTTAYKGDRLTLEATPAEGFTFGKWTVTYMDGETEKSFNPSANTFYMPAANVTVSASFVKEAVVPVYASVAELIAAGKPTTTGTKVTVTITDEEIIKFHTLRDGTVAGAIIKVGTQEVEIFCKGTPSDWKVGGTISGTLTNCDWKLYGFTWELCPADYSELTYKAPLAACATPVITIAEGGAVSISCETEGATIHYTVGENPADPTEADAVFGAVTLTDGQTIKAIAVAEGFKPSAVASKKYTVGGAALVDKTATIKFGTNDVKIEKASVIANDDQKNSWTITTVGTTSFTQNASYSQVGSSKKPATSITFTTTLPEDAEVTSISAKFGGFGSTAGTVTLKVGETSVGTGNLNETNDVTVTSTSTAVGNKVTITVTGIAKGVKCYNIQVKYKTAN